MKQYKLQTQWVFLLVAFNMALTVHAQDAETYFSLQNITADSAQTSNYYSTVFYVEDEGRMYQKLDSIFSALDTSMVISIRVTAYKGDSLVSHANINRGLDLDLNGLTDSVYAQYKLKNMDSRIKTFLETGKSAPDRHIVIEQNTKQLKTVGETPTDTRVRQIFVSDAEILIKGGVLAKIITAPALQPTDTKVHFKVFNENNKKHKTMDISFTLKETKNLQILILDKKGRVLFEENKKKFSGIYHTSIEIKDEYSPYYFVAIGDKKMFGRMVRD